jgi:hypothetical protein
MPRQPLSPWGEGPLGAMSRPQTVEGKATEWDEARGVLHILQAKGSEKLPLAF